MTVTLTSLELSYLRLSAAGKRRGEVAKELHYNDSYLRDVRTDFMRKLGANNTTHAVAIAIRSGYIEPPIDGAKRRYGRYS